MFGEIITIGNELISGRTIDLNSWYAAGRLTAAGLRVIRIKTVGDDQKMVSEALRKTMQESRFVIVTGGLGSTDDDMTCEIVAKALNRSLCLDQQMLEKVKSHAEKRGTSMTPSLEKMARMPEGSKILSAEGNACGFSLKENDVHLYFLPGVHDQMCYLIDNFVIPEIVNLFKPLPFVGQRVLKVYGLNEPSIAESFKQLKGKTGEVVFGFYPRFPENHITMSLHGNDEPNVTKQLDRVEKQIKDLMGSHVFTSGNNVMEDVIGRMLMDRNLTISVAESCTGGLIGHRLTNVPGSSKYFQGGVIVYSNQSKVNLVDVNPETLEKHGEVSNRTVIEMAQGVRRYMRTDLGLAVTGIAGPDGGTREKPVGTVHVGLAVDHDVFSGKYRFWGNRAQNKLNTSMMALDFVRRYINGDPFLPGI